MLENITLHYILIDAKQTKQKEYKSELINERRPFIRQHHSLTQILIQKFFSPQNESEKT